jgi:tRNA-dihydrouridine synthase B
MRLIDDLKDGRKPVIAAPLAGYTDPALASILLSIGQIYMMYPFVSSEGVLKNRKYLSQITEKLTQWCRLIHTGSVHIQIFGSNPAIMAEASQYLTASFPIDALDLNMGCSVPKIWKSQSGSWLLKDPGNAVLIIESVKNAVKIPITLKTRIGWDKNDENGMVVIREAEKLGISAVTLHPRHGKYRFDEQVDWSYIKKTVEEIRIPVIGNGDIESYEDAKKMIDETGCAGIMIGRASIGNPWIFPECSEYLQRLQIRGKPSYKEKIDICIRHLESLVEYRGEETGVKESRKHMGRYLKSMPGASEIRQEVIQKNTLKEVKSILLEYYKRLSSWEESQDLTDDEN